MADNPLEVKARKMLARHMPGCGALGRGVLAMIEAAMLDFASEVATDHVPDAGKMIATPDQMAGVDGEVTQEPYLVWSNEHRAWWAPNECGYTRRVERAGRYDRVRAFQIAGTRGGGWPLEGNPFEIAIPERDAVEQSRPAIRQGTQP